MNLNFRAGNSPLASRQNPVIYLVLVVATVVVAVFVGVWSVAMLRKKERESPEFKKREMTRQTKFRDVISLAKKYSLKEEFIPILWYVCRTFKIPNIYYSIKSFDKLDGFFKSAYLSLKNTASEEKINNLFKLKFYLDKIFAESVVYHTTRTIPTETKLTMLLKKGATVPCGLEENAENFLAVEIPSQFYDTETKPEPMTKIAFIFHSPSGMPHAFVSRILRYQELFEKKVMYVSHSSDVITNARRHNKRVDVDEKCRFTAVSVKKDEDGKKIFIPKNKKYAGKLTNISGGGCCIASNLPIKEGQLVGLEFDLFDGTIKTVATIVKSRKTNVTGVYSLHMKYVSLSTENQNKILAKVYNYD